MAVWTLSKTLLSSDRNHNPNHNITLTLTLTATFRILLWCENGPVPGNSVCDVCVLILLRSGP